MMNNDGEQRVTRLLLRNRGTLTESGEVAITSTVYCRLKERSVGVVECQGCERFRALHFDSGSRTTSVACSLEASVSGSVDEAAIRNPFAGPLDPRTPLADIMTKEIVCVRSDVGIEEVKALLVERRIGSVTVVDERGAPIGVISSTDVLRAEHDDGDTLTMEHVTARPKESDNLDLRPGYHLQEPVRGTAGDIMSHCVLALHEGANVVQAASLMAFEGVHQLPVTADGGELVGIVSSLDVLRWLGRCNGYLIPSCATRERW